MTLASTSSSLTLYTTIVVEEIIDDYSISGLYKDRKVLYVQGKAVHHVRVIYHCKLVVGHDSELHTPEEFENLYPFQNRFAIF